MASPVKPGAAGCRQQPGNIRPAVGLPISSLTTESASSEAC
jgi:hypothetical protein